MSGVDGFMLPHQPVQLFNLKEDPDELHDRSRDPACQRIVNDLTAQVLDGWNPETIAQKMAGFST